VFFAIGKVFKARVKKNLDFFVQGTKEKIDTFTPHLFIQILFQFSVANVKNRKKFQL